MSLEMFPCPHCPAEFDSLHSLEHHLGAMHNEVLPNEKFRCSTCDAEFMAQMEWMDHMEDMHDDAAEPVEADAAAPQAAT